MNQGICIEVASIDGLLNALSDQRNRVIELASTVVSPHDIFLPTGVTLRGKKDAYATLAFSEGGGVGLMGNNVIDNLTILSAATSRAIFLMAGVKDYGTLKLSGLHVTGQVGLIMRAGSEKAVINAESVHVAACDSRAYTEQPQKYGVNVLQGAFTVYNFNPSPTSKISLSLNNISIGSKQAPVFGSGLFVSGFGDELGLVDVEKMTTGAIYSTGLLTAGTADFITGGVFLVYGAHAKLIENYSEVVTYGTNDMVLDNWGTVDQWICHKPVISYGPSGIGFVNFGVVGSFLAKDAVITYGQGARGFNQYDGTVNSIRFKQITTYGNGSIGIQISKPIGAVTIDENVETFGSVGNSLVKGVNLVLHAVAISIKPGGVVDAIQVGGDVVTHADGVSALTVEGDGLVKSLSVGGAIKALGGNASAVILQNSKSCPLGGVSVTSSGGAVIETVDGA